MVWPLVGDGEAVVAIFGGLDSSFRMYVCSLSLMALRWRLPILEAWDVIIYASTGRRSANRARN